MLILAFLILLIILPIYIFIKIMTSPPDSFWFSNRSGAAPPRPHSPRPDFNVQRPDFNVPNPNRDKPSKPKQQMYFEYTDHGLSNRYKLELDRLLMRSGSRIELEVAWLMDKDGINGARAGFAGGKSCYIIKFQDTIDRAIPHNDYIEVILCGYAPETRYIGRRHVLYFPNWWAYKPTMFISSVRFLED